MKRFTLLFLLFICSLNLNGQQITTPSTALTAYLNNNDATQAWEVHDTYPLGQSTVYSLFFISQKWQGILWKHELLIFVPNEIKHDGALLFITGSAVENGLPKYSKKDDGTSQIMEQLAQQNKAVVAVLRQVPNQPLYDGLIEDALISYTLNEFKKSKDYSWPLLFPMVKSAIKAMDVVQEFSSVKLKKETTRFLVSGASKRGWTTWLTGASQDPRVVAIAPMVIDMLNMPVTLDYQKQLYNEYSEEINDYVNLEIPQAIHSEFGSAVVQMIDPYFYRDKLTVPKLILMGTNDPYWTLDAIKHYINEIPGKNMLHYVPNAGHDLGDKTQAFGALNAYFSLMLNKEEYPVATWNLTEKGNTIQLNVMAHPSNLIGARLWEAASDTRDFRKSKWNSSELPLNSKNKSAIAVKIKKPQKGYKGFYVDLIYKDPKGEKYSISTRTYVSDKKQVFVK